MKLFKKSSKSKLRHAASAPALNAKVDLTEIPPLPAPSQMKNGTWPSSAEISRSRTIKRPRSTSPDQRAISSSAIKRDKFTTAKPPAKRQVSGSNPINFPPELAPSPGDQMFDGSETSIIAPAPAVPSVSFSDTIVPPKKRGEATKVTSSSSSSSSALCPVPRAWNGSMLNIYDFVSAMKAYFHKVPHSITKAVIVLSNSIPTDYLHITDAVPEDSALARMFFGIDANENRTFIWSDKLMDYFLEEAQPPAEPIVQLAHTHNFMTAECTRLSAVQSFNVFHRDMANKANASEDIRKYAYITSLDKDVFKDIRVNIDPAMNYTQIQAFVLQEANRILEKKALADAKRKSIAEQNQIEYVEKEDDSLFDSAEESSSSSTASPKSPLDGDEYTTLQSYPQRGVSSFDKKSACPYPETEWAPIAPRYGTENGIGLGLEVPSQPRIACA